jgi:hypothetical protein
VLAKAEVDHLQFRVGAGIAEEEVLELQVAVDDPLRVDVPHGAQHLLDEAGALRLGVVVIRLLVESVEQLPPPTKLLDEVYLRMGLVYLLETDDVGMIELAHDVYLLAQLLQALVGVDEAKVEALDRVFETRGLMRNEPYESGYAGSQNRTVVHAVVYLLDGLAEGDLFSFVNVSDEMEGEGGGGQICSAFSVHSHMTHSGNRKKGTKKRRRRPRRRSCIPLPLSPSPNSRTSMCTTRSDIVLAFLLSSIILSNPRTLGPRFKALPPCRLPDEPECAEPSKLGVGVVERDRVFDRGSRVSRPPPLEGRERALVDGDGGRRRLSFAEDRALEAAALGGDCALMADSVFCIAGRMGGRMGVDREGSPTGGRLDKESAGKWEHDAT